MDCHACLAEMKSASVAAKAGLKMPWWESAGGWFEEDSEVVRVGQVHWACVGKALDKKLR